MQFPASLQAKFPLAHCMRNPNMFVRKILPRKYSYFYYLYIIFYDFFVKYHTQYFVSCEGSKTAVPKNAIHGTMLYLTIVGSNLGPKTFFLPEGWVGGQVELAGPNQQPPGPPRLTPPGSFSKPLVLTPSHYFVLFWMEKSATYQPLQHFCISFGPLLLIEPHCVCAQRPT